MLKKDNKGKESSSTDSFLLDEDESFNQIDEEEHLPMKEKFLVNFNSKVVYQKCYEEKKFGEKHHLTYKFVKFETKLIKKILDGHGFEQLHTSSPLFNLMWTSSSIKSSTYQTLLPFQRVNHFPKSSELTRKDRLYQNIQKMQQDKGFKHFDFVPTTFVLPKQFNQFQTTFEKEKGVWIVKPIASSQGRGIFLINSVSNVPRDADIVVSRYISNPLLIDGYKFDVRMYVAVTSFDPLVIYLYQEGLTRFATIKYDRNIEHLTNNFMHLTNYSVNKENNRYIRCDDPDVEDYGNKWTMSAMLRLLKNEGKDTFSLMMSIEDLIIKTFLSVQNQISNACQLFVPHKSNCFEIYGFDILIDDQLKPWLIEVNLSPSLNCDAPIDLKVKSGLICDLFNLILIPPLNIYRYLNNNGKDKQSESMLNNISMNESKFKMDELMLIKRIEEENHRCGCFIRIFPCEEMFEYFQNYISEDKLHFHSLIHQYLYPNRWRKSHHRKQVHRNHLQRCKYLSTIYHLSRKNSSIGRNWSQLSNAMQRFHSYHKTSNEVKVEDSLMNLLTCSSLNQMSLSTKKSIRMNSSSADRVHLYEKENRKNLYRVSSAPKEEFQRKFSRKPPLERPSRAISSITKRSSGYLSSSFSNDKSMNDEDHHEDFVDQLNELSSKQHRRQYSGSVSIIKEIQSNSDKSPQRLPNPSNNEEEEIPPEKLHRMKKIQFAKQAKLFQEKLRRNEIYSALNRYSHVPRATKISVTVIHQHDRRKSAK